MVPLDLALTPEQRLVLLSGPNAGGKTVALKTVGLVALMAQAGIPVLAEAGSSLPHFSRVWCHLGDEQNLFSDLSTFTGAMRATAALLAEADADTLVLYDELGSGTDPEEGAALAAALVEELARRGCWTVATAHLITVAAHLEEVAGAVNAAMGFDETSGRPTYRLHLGAPGRSRGLAIASSCGVPAAVLARAREMVSRSFLAIDAYLGALALERERLQDQTERLRAAERRSEEDRSHLEREARRLAEERETVRARLDQERDALRRRAREQLAAALAELERARERGEFPGKRRLAALRHQALALEPEQPASNPPSAPLAPGATVRLAGTTSRGRVQRVVGERVEVLVGDKRLWIEASGCEPIAPPPPGPPPGSKSSPPPPRGGAQAHRPDPGGGPRRAGALPRPRHGVRNRPRQGGPRTRHRRAAPGGPRGARAAPGGCKLCPPAAVSWGDGRDRGGAGGQVRTEREPRSVHRPGACRGLTRPPAQGRRAGAGHGREEGRG